MPSFSGKRKTQKNPTRIKGGVVLQRNPKFVKFHEFQAKVLRPALLQGGSVCLVSQVEKRKKERKKIQNDPVRTKDRVAF